MVNQGLGIENLNKLFNSQRIAVIGASGRVDSLGAKILYNLIGVGSKGNMCRSLHKPNNSAIFQGNVN
jgi:hypothetical protein